MTILATGGEGQLGRALARASSHEPVIALGREELDITRPESIQSALSSLHPGFVVNAAAYTAVDRAEEERDAAWGVNRDGVVHLAEACLRADIPLIHISTDYVFDGVKSAPYTEEDPPHPLCVYGESKLAGEEALRSIHPRHVILRTSWIFSSTGHNFVRTILRLGRERQMLRVVDDQKGCPTPAAGLAAAILQILARLNDAGAWGTYHLAGAPPATWHGFAQAIIEEGRRYEPLAVEEIVPISTADFPTPARRPSNSVLDCRRARETFGVEPPPWRDGLRTTVEEMHRE